MIAGQRSDRFRATWASWAPWASRAWAAWLAAVSGAVGILCCSSGPPSQFYLERARQSAESGDLENALRDVDRALQQRPFEPDAEEVSLQVEILRELDRGVEADALEEFARRYAAGEATDSQDTIPTLDECKKLERKRAISTRLIREYGDVSIPAAEYDVGLLAATFGIDAEGRPVAIRVIRAANPAAAWRIIELIGGIEVWKVRLAETTEAFPIPHCVSWDLHPRLPQRTVNRP